MWYEKLSHFRIITLMAAHPLPIPTSKGKFDFQAFSKLAPRLISLIKPEIKIISIGLIALFIGSLLNLGIPYVIKIFLDKSSIEGISNYLNELTLSLFLIFIIQGCCFYARHYYLQLAGLKIVTRLKEDLVKALLNQNTSFYDLSNTGDLLSRVSADTEAVQRGLSINISVVIRYTIQVIGGIILMMLLSVKLSSIILLIIPLLAIFSIFWSQKLKVLSSSVQKALGESSISVEEALNGIRTVKVFSAEEKEFKRFSEKIHSALKLSNSRTHIAALFSSSMVTILHISIAVVFYFGISAVSNNELTNGELTAFLLYCTIVAVSFGFLTNAWAEFVQSIGAAERVYEILDKEIEDSSNSENSAYSENISKSSQDKISNSTNSNTFEICFKEVSFSYPSRPDKEVLSKIDFKMEAGKTLALVGPSGSGKSSIASLIPRLYEPTSGQILLNGRPINELKIKELRKDISFVAQNVHLFSASLRYNLTYGTSDYTEEKLHEIIKLSSLESFINTLPEGLETQIGDKGILLSGGERQRVSIARSLLQNPDILILDEATSALDSENEKAVQFALKNLLKNRTTLMIAHRLSTIQHADLVLVLKEGKIIQKGTHESLMNEQGLYKTMVEYQLL